MVNPEEGRKYDAGKPEYGLIPLKALEEMTKVLTVGAKKYSPGNWAYVDDAQNRYYDALFRHLVSWKSGEKNDPETGLNHLAHAACCVYFIMERDIVGEEEWNKRYPKKEQQ